MTDARRLAVDALVRIEDGAYANLVLPPMLERSGLAPRDRAFVTELTYGTTRMRRSCDWAVDRFLLRPPDIEARALLRLGAYQLLFLNTPPHAAVSATVEAAPRRLRGFVNAILRRVAAAPREWPDRGTELSYPDWIINRLIADIGEDAAVGALRQMNVSGETHERDDGYIQDPASQAVATYVGATAGELVLDACGAPGGKATALAAAGADVVAGDIREPRSGLVARNVERLGYVGQVSAIVADGRQPPYRAAAFDRVLIDAPCTGLGVLRRRPDARWRIQPDDVDSLQRTQCELVEAASSSVRAGGTLVYSVCTMTAAETIAIDRYLEQRHPELAAEPPPEGGWTPAGRGALLLPQVAGTDGMYVLKLRKEPSLTSPS